MTDELKIMNFEDLISENASCLEFAMNGYIRIYEKDEAMCECIDCIRKNEDGNPVAHGEYLLSKKDLDTIKTLSPYEESSYRS